MSQDICVIVPTIREYECMRSYFENARSHGFDLSRLDVILVTEDFCETDEMAAMLADEGVSGEVFDGTRRQEWYERHGVSEYSHIVPAASHAETSFGLLYMWAGDYEYGFFIDDDTLPHDEWDFFGTHLENLAFEGEIETVSSDEQWVNVLYQNADEHDLYPRGYPYSAMHEDVETEQAHDMVLDATALAYRAEAANATLNLIANNRAWGNAPDLARTIAHRILDEEEKRDQH